MDNMANKKSNKAIDPLPENQAEREDEIVENDTSGRVAAPPPPPICLEDDDVDMETLSKFMETQDGDRVMQSTSNAASNIIFEPDINMDTSDLNRTQKRQRNQQQGESKLRHREGIKRSLTRYSVCIN